MTVKGVEVSVNTNIVTTVESQHDAKIAADVSRCAAALATIGGLDPELLQDLVEVIEHNADQVRRKLPVQNLPGLIVHSVRPE